MIAITVKIIIAIIVTMLLITAYAIACIHSMERANQIREDAKRGKDML